MPYVRTLLCAALVAAMTITPAVASDGPVDAGPDTWDGTAEPVGPMTTDDYRTLLGYADDTWLSMVAMTDEDTGLTADNVGADLSPTTRAAYTSPTNIGGYLWSTIVARDLRIIDTAEARTRLSQTIATLATLEKHEESGMFYNWYDPETGAKLTVWPEDGSPVYPFMSSVDNGWLAAALRVAGTAEPDVRAAADAVRAEMDFGFYYDPDARGVDAPAGLIRGGFWDEEPPGCFVEDNYGGGETPVYYTCHHYGSFNTEPRIASYLGIVDGDIPAEHYFGGWRTFPDTCDWSWPEQKPVGEWREYLGVPVFEGAYQYRDLQLVPTWGGSMFEALMVPLFVPEERWGKRSWKINHPLTVEAHIQHGMDEAGYGYWGFSPSNDPAGGYREYGVDAIGMEPTGYTSDQERTTVDYGFEGCREGAPPPTEYGDGVVTPHASFLALRYAPRKALDNLANIKADFDAYGPGGFHDAVAVRSGTTSAEHLALDQSMIMAAIGNEVSHNAVRYYFTRGGVRESLAPLMRIEAFNVGRIPPP